ncbi:hypothetical protein F5Y10DRAFT_242046 [Nemania abortiva]|nr:hypothetical protein F5Y10DRAFT_242046 [Nemania abortiva]
MSFVTVWTTSPIPTETRSSYSRELRGSEPSPTTWNLLSFLATAQALIIELLPVTWEAARPHIGDGGTAVLNMSALSLQNSLAFKRIHESTRRRQSEAKIFKILTNEIVVLGSHFVRQHPNIAQLEGISFEVSRDDDKPWPVLVFEKAQYGDLNHFAQSPIGRQTDINMRLKLCLDIATAVHDMSLANIIHGDIKPDNVLVFEDPSGGYAVKVCDFGFSAHYKNDQDRIVLARSVPWNAPEHDRLAREWRPSEAARTDIFSVGLLCFWLLFEPILSGSISISASDDLSPFNVCQTAEKTLDGIKPRVQLYAESLLATNKDLNSYQRQVLRDFFRSSLNWDPRARDMSIEILLSSLRPQPELDSPIVMIDPSKSWSSSDFKIGDSVHSLYECDYRLRSYIASLLCTEYQHNKAIALELAICFYTGFGVNKDQERAMQILKENNEDIESMKSRLLCSCPGHDFPFQKTMLQKITGSGLAVLTDFSYTYLEHQKLPEAEARIKQELHDLTELEDNTDEVVEALAKSLFHIYYTQRRLNEAEEVASKQLQLTRGKLGEKHPRSLSFLTLLGSVYANQGRFSEAIGLMEQSLAAYTDSLGEDHPFTLAAMSELAKGYADSGRLDEAENMQLREITLREKKLGRQNKSMATSLAALSSIYNEQGKYEEAEAVALQGIDQSESILGHEHPETLTSKIMLIVIYQGLGRYADAEKLGLDMVETCTRVLGEEHALTLASIANLAMVYHSQGNDSAAEELQGSVISKTAKVMGAEHPTILSAMDNLTHVYRDQQKLEKAEELHAEIILKGRRILGPNHPAFLGFMQNAGRTYASNGKWAEAEEVQVDVVTKFKERLGEESPHTLRSMSWLSAIYRSQEKFDEAEDILCRCVVVSRTKYGLNHPFTLKVAPDLAILWWQMGDHDSAITVMKACQKAYQELHGPDSQLTQASERILQMWQQPPESTTVGNEESNTRVSEGAKCKDDDEN